MNNDIIKLAIERTIQAFGGSGDSNCEYVLNVLKYLKTQIEFIEDERDKTNEEIHKACINEACSSHEQG